MLRSLMFLAMTRPRLRRSHTRDRITRHVNATDWRPMHDHLCFVDSFSGCYVESPEDIRTAGAQRTHFNPPPHRFMESLDSNNKKRE